MIRNEQDKKYSDAYPLIYKKIYDSLKTAKTVIGNKGVTAVAIYENIRKIASCETIKDILDNVSWANCDGARYYFSETEIEKTPMNTVLQSSNIVENNNTDELQTSCTISFSEIPDLSYTRPVYVSYFGDEIQGFSSWKQLYVNVFKVLYDDYNDRIPLNQSFTSNNGRMDFCTDEYYTSMVAPKEILNGKYLETNLSATDVVRKIKRLLDICLVDEENLIIRYEKKADNQYAEETKTSKRIKNSANGEAFFNWLNYEQGMATPTCRSYVSAVNTAERYAKENGFDNCKLYTENYQEAKRTADELFRDKTFIEYNNMQHNRFRAGINKLLIYIENGTCSALSSQPSADLEPFTKILIERFSKGYRITSPLELRKFKIYWKETRGSEIEIADDDIKKSIERCGIVHEEKVYMPQKMLDEDTQMKLGLYSQ